MLAILGALFIGLLLGVFGSGGSILTVPVVLYWVGHEPKVAIVESLAIVAAIAGLGALPHLRARGIDWRAVRGFGMPAMVGAYGGAWAAGFLPGSFQVTLLAAVLLVAAFLMWSRVSVDTRIPDEPSFRRLGVTGLGVGVLTGVVGVGGGFLIVPALSLLAGLEFRRAVGTSLVIIAMSATVGFAGSLSVLEDPVASLDFGLILTFALIGFVAAVMGRSLQYTMSATWLQRAFAILVVGVAMFLMVRIG